MTEVKELTKSKKGKGLQEELETVSLHGADAARRGGKNSATTINKLEKIPEKAWYS